MPPRDNRTIAQLRAALHRPGVFAKLSANDKRFVDAMKEREDAGVATGFAHERLMRSIAAREDV